MKTEQTSKKWYYEFSRLSNFSPEGHFIVKDSVVGRPICVLPMPIGGINAKEKQESNAKLISAAPDLLKSLISLVGLLESKLDNKELLEYTMQWSKKAIEKATK
jgi:hypothetical protein